MSARETINVRYTRDAGSTDIPLPLYATDGACGADIRSAQRESLAPGEFKAISTGLRIELPAGYECQVRPRSGLAMKHGVTVLNAPGTIDADYRGEIKVILVNHGRETFQIERGDRIAQLVFAPVTRAIFSEAQDLSSTDRGSGGFGHTGRSS